MAQLEVWRADHRRPGPQQWPVKQELSGAATDPADDADGMDSDGER